MNGGTDRKLVTLNHRWRKIQSFSGTRRFAPKLGQVHRHFRDNVHIYLVKKERTTLLNYRRSLHKCIFSAKIELLTERGAAREGEGTQGLEVQSVLWFSGGCEVQLWCLLPKAKTGSICRCLPTQSCGAFLRLALALLRADYWQRQCRSVSRCDNTPLLRHLECKWKNYHAVACS